MLQIGDTFQDGGAVFTVKKFGADGALVGSVTWYAGAGTPENYLLCDGSTVSRTDYADLFAVIGTTYGAGDGSTTFNLPLLTDNRFIEGSDVAGTQHEAGLPNIEGTFGPVAHGLSTYIAATGMFSQKSANTVAQGTGSGRGQDITLNAKSQSNIYGSSTTVQPQSLALRPLIKYI